MVFQKPNPFPMSIYDNIAYGPRTHGIRNKAKLDEIVEKSLRGAAIWDEVKDRLKKVRSDCPADSSSGFASRARWRSSRKDLLMDEPTSALDPISTSKIEELAVELKKSIPSLWSRTTCSRRCVFPTKRHSSCSASLSRYGDTEKLFSQPQDKRTEDYITGRFG